MARAIDDSCINCGSCEFVCPMEAIYEGDGKREVNEDKCVDCFAGEMQCPVHAIHES